MSSKTFREHPDLNPDEKEITITYNKSGDSLLIHSDIPSINEWLLKHPEFTVQARETHQGAIIEVRGTLPVGCLMLKGQSRKSTAPGDIRGSLPES